MLVDSPSFSCNVSADREANPSHQSHPERHAVVRAGPHGPGGTAGPSALLASPALWRDEKISGLLWQAGKSLGLPRRLCLQRWRQEGIGDEEHKP